MFGLVRFVGVLPIFRGFCFVLRSQCRLHAVVNCRFCSLGVSWAIEIRLTDSGCSAGSSQTAIVSGGGGTVFFREENTTIRVRPRWKQISSRKASHSHHCRSIRSIRSLPCRIFRRIRGARSWRVVRARSDRPRGTGPMKNVLDVPGKFWPESCARESSVGRRVGSDG